MSSSYNFTNANGTTVARTASLALMYWNNGYRSFEADEELIELKNSAPIALLVGKNTIPGPYDEALIPLSISICERNWNKKPDVEDFLENDNVRICANYSGTDFKQIVKMYETGYEDILVYENTCLKILKWLEEIGEIRELKDE